jgi:hypothetical protein
LLDLADVAPALTTARDHVDAALRHRALRRQGGQVAAEISLRAAVASAALQGHAYELAEIRAGTVTDPVVQGALRVAEGLGPLVDLWPRAPRQVLARLHVLAARGAVSDAELGVLAATPGLAARLDGLATLVRAAARITLSGRGHDPRGLVAVEEGHREREPEYVGAAGAYATGTPDGVRSWLRHYASAVEIGAARIAEVGDETLQPTRSARRT